jgi:DNA-binding transcriptional ArsR family regulator
MAKHDISLDLIFQALSDPTRRAILAQLGQGAQAVSVSVLARPTGLALPTVMRHLEVLEGAGLISTLKAGRARMCRAEPAALAPIADWLALQRAQWEGRLDRLETYVQSLKQETRDD